MKPSSNKVAIDGFLKKVCKSIDDLTICKVGNDDSYAADGLTVKKHQ